MATILKLTEAKKQTPIRINFDLVSHYYGKGTKTEFVFIGQRYVQEMITVKESMREIDRLPEI